MYDNNPQYPAPYNYNQFNSAPPPKQTHKMLWLALAILIAGGMVLGTFLIVHKGGSDDQPKEGYYTAGDIEPDLLMSTNNKLANNPEADFKATDVTCVDTSDREYRCIITFDDDDTITVIVDVSKDYQTWVSHGD